MGPKVMPKLIDRDRCRRCGRCVMGCRSGAKWDARRFLDDAVAHGAALLTGARVDRLALDDGRAAGVVVHRRGRRRLLDADLVVLAAGGLGTPKVLERSGVPTDHRLFVDPVLCVAGRQPGARQDAEVPMPFYAELDGVVISPYFDYLSFFFDRRWRARGSDLLPLMIKLADDACGSVSRRRVSKPLSATDRDRLREGVEACRSILTSCGVPSRDIRLGTLNAGHPGGTVPLTPATARSLHDPRLPRNVYVADASLLPRSLGKPPSFTIMALALRVARAAAAYAD
jgi:choline dehydrogenase-like flavoprotein